MVANLKWQNNTIKDLINTIKDPIVEAIELFEHILDKKAQKQVC